MFQLAWRIYSLDQHKLRRMSIGIKKASAFLLAVLTCALIACWCVRDEGVVVLDARRVVADRASPAQASRRMPTVGRGPQRVEIANSRVSSSLAPSGNGDKAPVCGRVLSKEGGRLLPEFELRVQQGPISETLISDAAGHFRTTNSFLYGDIDVTPLEYTGHWHSWPSVVLRHDGGGVDLPVPVGPTFMLVPGLTWSGERVPLFARVMNPSDLLAANCRARVSPMVRMTRVRYGDPLWVRFPPPEACSWDMSRGALVVVQDRGGVMYGEGRLAGPVSAGELHISLAVVRVGAVQIDVECPECVACSMSLDVRALGRPFVREFGPVEMPLQLKWVPPGECGIVASCGDDLCEQVVLVRPGKNEFSVECSKRAAPTHALRGRVRSVSGRYASPARVVFVPVLGPAAGGYVEAEVEWRDAAEGVLGAFDAQLALGVEYSVGVHCDDPVSWRHNRAIVGGSEVLEVLCEDEGGERGISFIIREGDGEAKIESASILLHCRDRGSNRVSAKTISGYVSGQFIPLECGEVRAMKWTIAAPGYDSVSGTGGDAVLRDNGLIIYVDLQRAGP